MSRGNCPGAVKHDATVGIATFMCPDCALAQHLLRRRAFVEKVDAGDERRQA